jgi:hypothetical protein
MKTTLLLLVLGLGCASCNGTTGDNLLTFSAYAAGTPEAAQGFPTFGPPPVSAPYSVRLTSGKMHIGAVYINESPLPTGGEAVTGIYNAQVPGPVDFDLLSSTPSEFSRYGNGTADLGQSWQIWLTDGDVTQVNTTHMIDLQGVATRVSDGTQYSFGAVVTINVTNRRAMSTDPIAQPGLDPISLQRILLLGPIDLTPSPGGTLTVTVDPRQWFEPQSIDFSTLPLITDDSCTDADSSVQPLGFTDYANGQTCESSSDCHDGTVCDTGGAPRCPAGNPCYCLVQYCIPDTSLGSGAGAQQGIDLFTGVQTGNAYSLDYSMGSAP